MRPRTQRLAVLLGLAVAACSDGVGPGEEEGIGLLFAIGVPAAVSADETEALGTAFGLVDSYQITVQDSVTEAVLVDTVSTASGTDEHRFDFELPASAVGLRVQIDVIAFDNGTELYRSTAFTTVEAVAGGAAPIYLPVRYTGPGVRGTVTNDAGVALGGVSVGLYQASSLVTSIATESDGTYLFLGVAAGAYSVEPTPPPSLFMCPVGRDLTVASNEALVADFVASSIPCQIDLLVLSGGDNDFTPDVAEMFTSTPGVTTDTYFFTNQAPGLAVLRQYDVVLLFTEGIFDETVALGTELEQYVAAGGNLVLGSFFWQGRSDSGLPTPGWGALEAWDPFTPDIDPFTGVGGATYTANDLGTVALPNHPLIQGVNTLVSVAGYSAGVLAKPSTTVVASWTDNAPLVGYRVLPAGQRVVGVSLFPGAANQAEVIGDVQVLWENAVMWAGVAGGPTP